MTESPYSGAAIEARGLGKSFGPVEAVRGVDLTVPAGEVFGLVGPDGAGKTTTIRMICGAMPPDRGTAQVAGLDVVARSEEVKRRLGYVPQRSSLYGELSVEENLHFWARVHGVRGKMYRDRQERLLSFSRLGRFRRRLARDLSGGMRQKLSLSCALLHEPEVLVLDEPTTGVDPVSRDEFWELLLGLAARGTTVLTSTAYMDEAERCSRVGLMYRGRMLAQGTPDEVRRQAGLELLQVACEPLLEGREAAQRAPGVRWVEVFGDRLHVAVESASQAEPGLRATLEEAVRVMSLRPIPPGLEDAFFELVRRGGGEQG